MTIVPVFIPHQGCPHQCVFCNQHAITGNHAPERLTEKAVKGRIETFLSHSHHRGKRVQIAFFGGNFLGLPPDRIIRLLSVAQQYVTAGVADSIRLSTRPDTIDAETLSLVAPFQVRTIELGVQSLDDHVLHHCRRGHTAADSIAAVNRLKAAGFEVGVQLMVGLPGEDTTTVLDMARQVVALTPSFARIYPTLVIAGSPLATLYENGDYRPLSLEDAVGRVKSMFQVFAAGGLPVIRMGIQPTDGLSDDVMAGPFHPAFGQLVLSAVLLEEATRMLDGRRITGQPLCLWVNSRTVAAMRGQKNCNISELKRRYGPSTVLVQVDEGMADNEVRVSVL